jgi:hypothetical protein
MNKRSYSLVLGMFFATGNSYLLIGVWLSDLINRFTQVSKANQPFHPKQKGELDARPLPTF